jgi:hypothetical protein
MWRYLKKRRALRAYRTQLATKLRKRYGRERYYTPEQVKRTTRDAGLSIDYVCYAMAMFCERDAFDAFHRAEGESCDYVAMRAEVGSAIGVEPTTLDATCFDTSFGAGTMAGADGGGGFDFGAFDGGGGSDGGGGCDGGGD